MSDIDQPELTTLLKGLWMSFRFSPGPFRQSCQERMKIPEQKMDYYKDRAEMYVDEDMWQLVLALLWTRKASKVPAGHS